MHDAWCPHCQRTVGPLLTMTTSSWLAGCGGCFGAFMALFFLIGIVLALAHVPTSANDGITRVAMLPVILVASVVGAVVLRRKRQRICPICRTASLEPSPARR